MKWAMLFVIALTTSPLLAKGYTSWGIGPQISFNVPNKSRGTHYANPHPSFGAGLNGVVHFSLGKAGQISYNPVFDAWFRVDDWDYDGPIHPFVNGTAVHNVRLVDWAINFNLFEARYYPPISKKIKPYVGLGLASISIYSYKEDINTVNNADLFYNTDTDAGIGANIYVGASFELNQRVTPFFELRGSGSKSAPNTFKMSVGIHFNKK